jgi:Tfp pilus assembly protein PilO
VITHYKIWLFAGSCLTFLLINGYIFLMPAYEKLIKLQQQNMLLKQNLQQLQQTAQQQHTLQQEISLARKPFNLALNLLHHRSSVNRLYMQIAGLAKANALQLIGLKPRQQQTIGGLEQQIVDLEITGSELKALNFLRLLMHQSWLLEVQALTLTPDVNGIRIQTTVAAYYVNH